MANTDGCKLYGNLDCLFEWHNLIYECNDIRARTKVRNNGKDRGESDVLVIPDLLRMHLTLCASDIYVLIQ